MSIFLVPDIFQDNMDVKMKDTVREWLAEYKSSPESSIPNYAATISQKKNVLESLIQLFSSCTRTSDNDLIQPVCHQLFDFYRSEHEELKIFTINLLPAIMLSHIIVSSSTTEVIPTGTLLLSIYMMENNTEESGDAPGIEIPQLATPSIYHDSMTSIFSERTVKNRNSGRLYHKSSFTPKYEDILPSNQFEILNLLLTVYCKYVCVLDTLSHTNLCKCCAFLACCGYPWQSKYLTKSECDKAVDIKRRIPLESDFSLTLLQGVYFALYNNCWQDAIKAVEAMKRRAKRELNSQVLMLSSAILNTATIEEKEQKFTRGENVNTEMPYGLGGQLTPILSRQVSRRSFRSRTAVTAKSIRQHKWQHHSEEISGDLSKSIRSTDLNETGSTMNTSSTPDDGGKVEKHPSPAKILKSKLKKSIPASAVASTSEKIRSPAPSGLQDKKANRKSQNFCGEDIEQEKQKHSPSIKNDTTKKSMTPVATKKHSKISSHKQASFDDSIMLTAIGKSKGAAFSKSTSDPVGPTVTGFSIQNTSISDTNYNPNESATKHNTSGSPLLGQDSSATESDGDEQNTMANGEKKESSPLLCGPDNPTKQKDIDQTGF